MGAQSTRLGAAFIAGQGALRLAPGEHKRGIAMRKFIAVAFAVSLSMGALPVSAQIRTVDPNAAAQADVMPMPGERGTAVQTPSVTPPPPVASPAVTPPPYGTSDSAPDAARTMPDAAESPLATQANTYKKDDLIGAAEGVFGKGAAGLAGIIERILKDQGEPNAYIAGREAAGAFVVGLRYGSGTMKHSVEGERPVYWTGPSVGFDVGGDATKVFTLVYNLYDTQDLYKRYPQVEGRAYFVGGFSATYLRRGSVVLIPVRLGVGVRLGANVGYLKFSEKGRWLPF